MHQKCHFMYETINFVHQMINFMQFCTSNDQFMHQKCLPASPLSGRDNAMHKYINDTT